MVVVVIVNNNVFKTVVLMIKFWPTLPACTKLWRWNVNTQQWHSALCTEPKYLTIFQPILFNGCLKPSETVLARTQQFYSLPYGLLHFLPSHSSRFYRHFLTFFYGVKILSDTYMYVNMQWVAAACFIRQARRHQHLPCRAIPTENILVNTKHKSHTWPAIAFSLWVREPALSHSSFSWIDIFLTGLPEESENSFDFSMFSFTDFT